MHEPRASAKLGHLDQFVNLLLHLWTATLHGCARQAAHDRCGSQTARGKTFFENTMATDKSAEKQHVPPEAVPLLYGENALAMLIVSGTLPFMSWCIHHQRQHIMKK